jgi:hypothetical protein
MPSQMPHCKLKPEKIPLNIVVQDYHDLSGSIHDVKLVERFHDIEIVGISMT